MNFRNTLYLGLALIGNHVFAQDLNLRYAELYNKQRYNQESSLVEVRSFLIDKQSQQSCVIKQIIMYSKQHSEQLPLLANGEVKIPVDAHLRKVNPDIKISVADGQDCNFHYQFTSKRTPHNTITGKEALQYQMAFSQLMTNLSGRVGSWFVPQVTGIEVHFKDSSSTDKLWINEFTATDDKHYELAIESITPLFDQSSN